MARTLPKIATMHYKELIQRKSWRYELLWKGIHFAQIATFWNGRRRYVFVSAAPRLLIYLFVDVFRPYISSRKVWICYYKLFQQREHALMDRSRLGVSCVVPIIIMLITVGLRGIFKLFKKNSKIFVLCVFFVGFFVHVSKTKKEIWGWVFGVWPIRLLLGFF